MKKLMILFVVLLAGCKCTLGQIPPQYIFAGDNCQAPLPDYTPRVTVSDNCRVVSLVQTPAPGFLLTADTPIANVVIKATDTGGNSTQINFNVMLIDTIPPVMTVDSTLITGDYEILNTLYNQADKILADKLNHFDAVFPYSKIGLPVADSSWYTNYMVVVSAPPDSLGYRDRVFEFWNPADSVPIVN